MYAISRTMENVAAGFDMYVGPLTMPPSGFLSAFALISLYAFNIPSATRMFITSSNNFIFILDQESSLVAASVSPYATAAALLFAVSHSNSCSICLHVASCHFFVPFTTTSTQILRPLSSSSSPSGYFFLISGLLAYKTFRIAFRRCSMSGRKNNRIGDGSIGCGMEN